MFLVDLYLKVPIFLLQAEQLFCSRLARLVLIDQVCIDRVMNRSNQSAVRTEQTRNDFAPSSTSTLDDDEALAAELTVRNMTGSARLFSTRSLMNLFDNDETVDILSTHEQVLVQRGNSFVSRSRDQLNKAAASGAATAQGHTSEKMRSKLGVESIKRGLHRVAAELGAMTRKLRDEEEDARRDFSWKLAAMVVDRICMVVFAAANIISTFAILFTADNFFKDSNPDPRF